MVTPETQRFIEKLHVLENFATERPEWLGSSGSDADLSPYLDEVKRHAENRVTAFDRLSAGEPAHEVCRTIGILDVGAADTAYRAGSTPSG
jgi:hypothetical protein